MKRLVKAVAVVAGVFLLASSTTFAGQFCKADCSGDCKVDLTDLVTMKSEFNSPDCEACSPPYPAPVEKTGQTTSYATGDDGDLEIGVASPNPRFTDNLDGTVTDNLTGLIWLKNANCFGTRTWNNALSDSNGLESGECGVTDGSSAGDWRLPNRFELESLLDLKNYNPALSSAHPFINVQVNFNYSTSTTNANNPLRMWTVNMSQGEVVYDPGDKDGAFYVWPVRGGH